MIYAHHDQNTLKAMVPWVEKHGTGNEINILNNALDGLFLDREDRERLGILAIQFLQTDPNRETRI